MSHDDHYDQPYDEEFDDSDAYVRTTSGYVGDAEALLQRAIDIIANAPKMPLSSSPRIDGDEIIELLDEALRRMPEEMRGGPGGCPDTGAGSARCSRPS